MKSINIKIKTGFVAFLLLTMSMTACKDDFFELTNPPEFPWLNMNELEFGVAGGYNRAFQSNWGGAFFVSGNVLLDVMTDQVWLVPNSGADYPATEVYNRQTSVPDISRTVDIYSAAYNTIGSSNSILDFLKTTNREPYKNMTPDDMKNIDRIEGEALLLRGLAYFYLLNTFAPAPGSSNFGTLEVLPLRYSFPKNAEEAIAPEFGTAEKIYEQAVKDLQDAKALLPEQYIEGLHHPSYKYGRANKFAAAAILARVQFRLGNYNEALAELNYIIENSPYRLNQDPIEAFNRSDNTQGNEVIWYALYYDALKEYTPKDATMYNFSDYRSLNGGRGENLRRGGWHQFTLSKTHSKQIGWMDDALKVTSNALQDKRYQQLYMRIDTDNQYKQITEPKIWVDKYYRGMNGQFTNVPIVRLAEIYLTRAILRIKNGDIPGATADVNVVRQRAGLEPLAAVTEQDIHNERIKELGFEGDWLIYVQSLKMPLNPGDRADVAPIEYPYEGLYWKIPQRELDFKNSAGN